MLEKTVQSAGSKEPDVVVIGGGLAGLAAAAYVARDGKSVTLYDKANSVGGQARSVMRDGFTLNQGPHALYRGGPAEEVLTELGVPMVGGQPPVKGRIVMGGTSDVAPGGPLTLLRTRALSAGDKFEVAKALALIPRQRPANYSDIAIDDWVAGLVTRTRPAEMLHALVRLSCYTNQPDQLSADVATVQLQAALTGLGVLYLDGGWQTLVNALQKQPGVTIVTGQNIEELPDARAVILATGGPAMTERLLGTSFNIGPPAHVSCLDLGLRRKPDHDFVLGGDVPFYFSNHSAAAKVAATGTFNAALVQYLAGDEEPEPDRLRSFAEHAGVRDGDIVTQRRLHKMKSVSAIATADRGGLEGRPKVGDTGHANVFMAGDWIGSIGHLADASLASGRSAAHAALRAVDKRRVSTG